MIRAVFNGSFDSLLCLADFLYESKLDFDEVFDAEDRASLFSENIYADRSAICTLHKLNVERLKKVFLANDKEIYKLIVKYYFEVMDGALTMETNAKMRELEQMVDKETHKYKGFIRFEMTEIGFFARIAPKHDILPLLAPHFWGRFGDDRVIFDEKRGLAAVMSRSGYRLVSASVGRFEKHRSEKEFEALWRKFFESVSIKERENKRAQQGFAPLRYREFMSEFEEVV